MTTHTTITAAAKFGCHPETVKRHCRQHGIGNLISGRLRILDEADLKRLKKLVQKGKGRPRKRPKSKRRKG